MKGKNEIFLSKSVSFAIEMVRASLRLTPTDIRLAGLWMQMPIASDLLGDVEFGQRDILFEILIHPGIKIAAGCSVFCVGGEWKSGNVNIRLLDSTGRQRSDADWKFSCELDANGQLNVQP